MKTKYRIISKVSYPIMGWTSRFLQFEYEEEIKRKKYYLFGKVITYKEVSWRFIPTITAGYLFDYLYVNDCPKFMSGSSSKFIDELDSDYDKNLIEFTKEYPNIEKYFEEIRNEHKKHKEAEVKLHDDIVYIEEG